MPGVGMPDAGAGTNLYWADRGQIIWSNGIDGPTGGIYATEISTGTPRQLVDNSAVGFGSIDGVDASNVYGQGSGCPKSACPFTVYGVSRNGGTPFVAYQTADAYRLGSPPQVDDSGLYWIDWDTFGIYHAVMAIGAPAELVGQVVNPPGIGWSVPARFAMDACNLYWLEVDPSGTTRLMAIAK
jgi:hypothetical protein